MIGAYALPKLLEAPGRLTDQVKQLRPIVVSYRLIAPTPTVWIPRQHGVAKPMHVPVSSVKSMNANGRCTTAAKTNQSSLRSRCRPLPNCTA